MLQHILTHVITHTVGIPLGPAEQVLHAVRTRLPRPPRRSTSSSCAAGPTAAPAPSPGYNPREPARYLAHQGLERLLPASSVYALARGHRTTVKSPHTSP